MRPTDRVAVTTVVAAAAFVDALGLWWADQAVMLRALAGRHWTLWPSGPRSGMLFDDKKERHREAERER